MVWCVAFDTGRRTPNLQRSQCLVQSETNAIGVLLVPEAKHQIILKKFCSVPFFDDHLHLMKYNMAAVNKRSNLFCSVSLYRMVPSVSLRMCLCLCLSVCLSVCQSVSQSVSLFNCDSLSLPPSPLQTQLLRHVSSPAAIRADGRQYVP